MERGYIGYYFNAGMARAGRSKVMFRNRVDDALDQIRNERMGGLVISEGFDVDGDMMFQVHTSAVEYLAAIAKTYRLELLKASGE